MNVPIGVSDPVPAYRHGLTGALVDAGLDAEAVEDAPAWLQRGGRRGLLQSVNLPEESRRLTALRARNKDAVIVALLRNGSPEAYREALREGANGAVAWHEKPEKVIQVLREAFDDYCLLPFPIARALTLDDHEAPELPGISAVEVGWLKMLAHGATIAELARDASYSEREMFRLLHRLYERVGASTRLEAIVLAARAGLLRGDGTPTSRGRDLP